MFGTRTQETSFFTAFDRRLSILTTRLLGLLFGLLGNHFSALLWVNTKVQKTQEKTACQLGDRCARGVPCGKEWLKIRFLEVHPRGFVPVNEYVDRNRSEAIWGHSWGRIGRDLGAVG